MLQLRFSSAIALLTHLALAAAQGSLIPTSGLPTCAATCSVLQQASTGCVPPQAPVTNQATYQSCFCQSALLSSLETDPTANICPSQCSNTDFESIASWYQGVCPTPGAVAAPGATTLATVTTATTPAVASATTGVSDEASSAPTGDHSDQAASLNGSAWFSTHWRWVIMVIVLAVGIALLAILGTLFHRRYRRRREAAENLGPRPDMATWAPNQASVHDVRDFGKEHDFGPGSGSGKGKANASTRGIGSKRSKKGKLQEPA